ncbi:FKBP-type peptidyl-prolyl cis-trans isomerase N-terminal domain-containing protein [Pantoea sp. SOD02]|uniref:FKBP-type peptidyl-prolyl cis-trans isomerase N-terminal domain-containing protein n=1 Tax=Pantoea sp. SOD02 TaxID=2970818 RepID=UPI002157F02F|nr:FKBP-type peptidyl-prolyl cis-trans isomerase N-terminal domain-containing protein [Pantoea sp. SOD02]UVC31655.1 FKBP-type peptidyl-prolyl cis-trans isomerase [Pantoea sp. SOD02]
MAFSRLMLKKIVIYFMVIIPYWGLPIKAQADSSGIPELLLFAKEYQAHQESQPENKSSDMLNAEKPKALSTGKKPSVRRSNEQQATLAAQERELKKLRAEKQAAEAALQAAQKEKASTAEKTAPALTLTQSLDNLQQFAAGVRKALSLTASEKDVKALIAASKERELVAKELNDTMRANNDELRNQLEILQQTHQQQRDEHDDNLRAFQANVKKEQQELAASQLEIAKLNEQVAGLQQKLAEQDTADKAQVKELQKNLISLQQINESQAAQYQHFEDLKRMLEEKESERVELAVTLKSVEAERDTLKHREDALTSPELLKSAAGKQSYAIGVSLAQDILALENEHKEMGVATDKNSMLAGIQDVFIDENQLKLSAVELKQAKQDADEVANKARAKTVIDKRKEGEKYLAKFKKQKGVKSSDTGFWYKVDYAGDDVIPEDATVSIVVKEMLTDGTVVQDMELADKVLSQPINDFPPLFQAAIRELRNHGSLTMVVPPEKAYGDKGYAPKIPPGATMIYVLRIAEIVTSEQQTNI